MSNVRVSVSPGAVLVAAAVIAAILPLPQRWVEQWYSRGFYSAVQPIVTRASSAIPVALLDIAVGLLVIGMAVLLVRRWRARAFRVFVREAAAAGLVLAAALYLWFLLLWGLNYRRVPLEQKVAYDVSRVSRARAVELAGLAASRANALVSAARAAQAADGALADSLVHVGRVLGSRRPVLTARPKRSLLGWYFREAAIDGMTDPFFLEIIVNPDLLPSERPFTLAHEWAHLAGYADESEANFVAWLACIRADPSARYSGWISAYQYLSAVLPPEERRTLQARLSAPVRSDLAAIAARLARSSPVVRTAARGVYDSYLRANRIEEGIANYGLVVRLMLGTSFDESWQPEAR